MSTDRRRAHWSKSARHRRRPECRLPKLRPVAMRSARRERTRLRNLRARHRPRPSSLQRSGAALSPRSSTKSPYDTPNRRSIRQTRPSPQCPCLSALFRGRCPPVKNCALLAPFVRGQAVEADRQGFSRLRVVTQGYAGNVMDTGFLLHPARIGEDETRVAEPGFLRRLVHGSAARRRGR